jgi:hypothetical protein
VRDEDRGVCSGGLVFAGGAPSCFGGVAGGAEPGGIPLHRAETQTPRFGRVNGMVCEDAAGDPLSSFRAIVARDLARSFGRPERPSRGKHSSFAGVPSAAIRQRVPHAETATHSARAGVEFDIAITISVH